jgi:hypothetical protein
MDVKIEQRGGRSRGQRCGLHLEPFAAAVRAVELDCQQRRDVALQFGQVGGDREMQGSVGAAG